MKIFHETVFVVNHRKGRKSWKFFLRIVIEKHNVNDGIVHCDFMSNKKDGYPNPSTPASDGENTVVRPVLLYSLNQPKQTNGGKGR